MTESPVSHSNFYILIICVYKSFPPKNPKTISWTQRDGRCPRTCLRWQHSKLMILLGPRPALLSIPASPLVSVFPNLGRVTLCLSPLKCLLQSPHSRGRSATSLSAPPRAAMFQEKQVQTWMLMEARERPEAESVRPEVSKSPGSSLNPPDLVCGSLQ